MLGMCWYGMVPNGCLHLNVICIIISFFLLCLAIFMAMLIRHWGEHTNISFWVQNIVGIFCLALLITIITLGDTIHDKKETEENKSLIGVFYNH